MVGIRCSKLVQKAQSVARMGLGGRRFGTVVSWFLIGGDLYTAYTFYRSPGTGGQFAVTTFAAGSSR